MSHSIYFKIFNRFLNTLLSRICHLYSWAQWLDVCDRKRSHSIHANDKTLIIYLLKRISRYSVYNIPKSTMWSTENTSIIPRKRFGVSLGGPESWALCTFAQYEATYWMKMAAVTSKHRRVAWWLWYLCAASSKYKKDVSKFLPNFTYL